MQKNVLVTGASTGIGFDTVHALFEKGFLVIATVRKNEDEAHLHKTFGDKVCVIKIDLSDLTEIEKLPEILKNQFNITQLNGLVNNAGIALAGPFALQDFSEVQSTIQINLLALMKITQVLLPLLLKDSRIINISSLAGKLASPFLAAYAASKHAVEGFSVALRKELMLLGIKVIIVAPGSIKTPIWKKGFEVVDSKYQNTVFAESFSRFSKIAANAEEYGFGVGAVSSIIVEAMTAENPKFRYAPVPRKFTNWYLPHLMPAKIYDQLTAKVLRLMVKPAKQDKLIK